MDKMLARQVAAGHISETTRTCIMDFLYDAMVEKGISTDTANTQARYIELFCRQAGCEVEAMSTRDVKRVISYAREHYKANTLRQYLIGVRAFLKHTRPAGVDLSIFDSIKPPRPDQSTKSAASMLTEDEIKRIQTAADNSRDLAFISLLYEGGFRPIELRRLTWGEVAFDQWGVVINVHDKTGIPRYIRIIGATQPLATWRNDYPGDPRGDAPVFVTIRGKPKPISRTGVTELVQRVAARAGLDGKHINPYLFRHSRITNMIRAEIPESVIRLQHWGTLRTTMLATYAHVTGEHIDAVLLEHAGIKEPEQPGKGTRAMDPVQCQRCSTINPPTAEWCYRCGMSFSEGQLSFEEWLKGSHRTPEAIIGYGEYLKKHPEKMG